MATLTELQNMAADVQTALADNATRAAALSARLTGITDPTERLWLGHALGHLGYQRKVLSARAALLNDDATRVLDGGHSAAQVVTTSAELTPPRSVMPVDEGLLPP